MNASATKKPADGAYIFTADSEMRRNELSGLGITFREGTNVNGGEAILIIDDKQNIAKVINAGANFTRFGSQVKAWARATTQQTEMVRQ